MNETANLIRAEMTRLSTPLTVAACFGPAAIIGALSVALPPEPLVGAVTVFIGGHAAVTAAYLLASDFRLGVIANQLLAQRSGVQLIAGKLVALSALATVIAVLAFTSAALSSALTGAATVPIGRLPALCASTLAYAAVGMTTGAVVRNPGGAVGLAAIWVMSLDGLLVQLARLHIKPIADWLPQAALTHLVALDHPQRGLTVVIGLIGLSYLTAIHTFQRRDLV